MAEHLSKQQFDAYRQQQLTPAELIKVDDHLAGCATCRQPLETALTGSAVALHAALLAVADALPDAAANPAHLTFEQMARQVDETLDRAEAPFVRDHAASCIQCARAVEDLRVFTEAGQEVNAVQPSHARTAAEVKEGFWARMRDLLWPSAPVPAFGLALAALLLIVLAGWLIRLAFNQKSPAPEFARQGAQPTVTPSLAPLPASTPAPEAAPLLAQLTDGSGQVTLDQQGKLSGLEELPPAYQRMVKEALTTQRLARPNALAGLNRRASSLMGADEQGNRFSLLAPAGQVILTDRPVFRWTPLGGAASYSVEIYDEQFSLLLKSPALQRTAWTPPQPLARGRVYAWQVKASKDGQEVQAPKPPATQARFRVLAQAQAGELSRARRAYGNAHLLLGLLYARAGLLDEAAAELRVLQSANPAAASVRRLRAELRALRR